MGTFQTRIQVRNENIYLIKQVQVLISLPKNNVLGGPEGLGLAVRTYERIRRILCEMY